MRNLFKILLSPKVNWLVGLIIGYSLFTSYKFFIIYCIMGPVATLANYILHKEAIEENNISWTLIIIGFIFSSLFWVNDLIAQSRVDFGLKEENINV